jgi:hypothetical protein
LEEDEQVVVVFLVLVAIDQVRLSLEIEFSLNIQAFVVKESVELDFVYQMNRIQMEVVFVQELVVMATKQNDLY